MLTTIFVHITRTVGKLLSEQFPGRNKRGCLKLEIPSFQAPSQTSPPSFERMTHPPPLPCSSRIAQTPHPVRQASPGTREMAKPPPAAVLIFNFVLLVTDFVSIT